MREPDFLKESHEVHAVFCAIQAMTSESDEKSTTVYNLATIGKEKLEMLWELMH